MGTRSGDEESRRAALAAAVLSGLPSAPVAVFGEDACCVALFGRLEGIDPRTRHSIRKAAAGQPPEAFLPADQAAGLRETIARVLAGRGPVFTSPAASLPAGLFPFETCLWPLEFEGARYVVALIRGAAEVADLRERLLANEQVFRAILERGDDIVCEFDAAGRILHASRSVARLGLDAAAVVGLRIDDLIASSALFPEADVSRLLEALRGLREQGRPGHVPLTVLDPGGARHAIEASGGAYVTSEGERRTLVVLRDAGRPFAGEDAGERAPGRGLAEKAFDLVLELDSEGRILGAPRCADHLAAGSGDLLDREVEPFLHPEDVGAARRAFERATLGGFVEPGTVRWKGVQGWHRLRFWLRGSEDPSGRRCVIALASEMMADESPDAEAAAPPPRAAAPPRDNLALLAGGVAHDFDNLLMVALGVADLIGEQLPPDSRLRTYLDDLVGACRQASDLARQLRACAGGTALALRPVELNEVVGGIGSVLHAAVPRHVGLDVQLCPGRTWVDGDPVQLRQMLINLVSSAAEAIGRRRGAIRIETRRLPAAARPGEDAPAQRLALVVRDDGPGLDEGDRRRLFEPHLTRRRGDDLGLAVVESIVRRHAGEIRVTSSLGHGTSVRIELPALPEQEARNAAPQRRQPASPPLATVLLVDDDEAVRRVEAALLGLVGYRVLEAADGASALERLRENPDVACAIVDLVMPDADGLVVIEELRRLRHDLPVVVCTGAVDRIPFLRGVSAALEKPFRYESLLETLARALSNRQA